MGGFITKLGTFTENTGKATEHTGALVDHAGTFYNQYQQLKVNTRSKSDSQTNLSNKTGGDALNINSNISNNNSNAKIWLAIGIVILLVIFLVRFNEKLVSNSPQLLSHENVELQEYSNYVPKLKLPYMFF